MAGLGGWALYLAALALAPLSLVQATSAGGIGLLAILVARVESASLPRADRAGVGIALIGLALLGLSMAGGAPRSAAGSLVPVGAWVGASAAGAGLALGPARRLLSPGGAYGVATPPVRSRRRGHQGGRGRGRSAGTAGRGGGLPRVGVRPPAARVPAWRRAVYGWPEHGAHQRPSDRRGGPSVPGGLAGRGPRDGQGGRVRRGGRGGGPPRAVGPRPATREPRSLYASARSKQRVGGSGWSIEPLAGPE
jgi:hypothetical protein